MVDSPRQTTREDVTRLLHEWSAGDGRAIDHLVPLLYDQLREIAHRHMRREATGATIHTTALVHEAYLGLVDQTRASWNDRVHFLAAASRAMRHILIDFARRRSAEKRGGGLVRVPLSPGMAPHDPGTLDVLILDQALEDLSAKDPQMGRVVECRYFGGMTAAETAEALGVTERTVMRIWKRARLHLRQALAETETP